ncbi:MAG: hypothetical protein ACRDIY_19685 [Chloroflexota bacterium]
MVSVGGIFHRRADAQQVADALTLAGVEPGSIRDEEIPTSLVDVLGPLGIPHQAIAEYERAVVPGDILLIVNTEALPAMAIVNEIGRVGGLSIEFGRAPVGHVGEQ